MRFKAGVDLNGVHPVTLRAMAAAEEVSLELGCGELIVTSVMDGTHRRQSKHYEGLAFDFRTMHLAVGRAPVLVDAVRTRLGDKNFDVIYENPHATRRDDGEHGHVEFDPK